MAEVIIRRFTEKDIPACASVMAGNALWQRYGVTEASAAARFASADPQKDIIFVAESGGQVVGFCWFIEKGAFNRSGYIQLIGVDPACQGKNIGKMLLGAAEEISFKNRRDMFLTVSDFNTAAQRFYRQNGYRQVGALPAFVLPDVTEMIYRKVQDPEQSSK